ARVVVGGLEHGTYPSDRRVELAVAAAEHERLAAAGLGEAEEHPKRGRLAGAVRPEEPGHGPWGQREADLVHRHEVAVALREAPTSHDRRVGEQLRTTHRLPRIRQLVGDRVIHVRIFYRYRVSLSRRSDALVDKRVTLRLVPKLWNETIEEHRRAVRDATLDTTAALVAKHGLRAVTMSQI